MPRVANYLELLEYFNNHLRVNQGKTINVSSHLTAVRDDFARATSTQQRFPYAMGDAATTSGKLLLMALDDDSLFELDYTRISRLEIKDGEFLVEEELGGFYRHNVLRVENAA